MWEALIGGSWDDPESRRWTITRRPGVGGWNTDSSYDGYGLPKALAEWLARVANEAEARGDLAPPLDESEYQEWGA